ncbi:MAG TPA: hypothetical protein VGH62_08695 [Bradyrhizobium sp.]
MARDPDHLAGGFKTENTGGLLTGFWAEEDEFDGRSLWRLGWWGATSVGAVIVALLANQSSIGLRRDQLATADLAQQSQPIQSVARESPNETRRLASDIETLNGDRDRLYSRVAVLEQGLDSVTGVIARQNSAAAPGQAARISSATAESQSAAQNPPPAPVVSALATTQTKTAEKPDTVVAVPESGSATVSLVGQETSNAPAPMPAPLMAAKLMMAPPNAAAAKLIESGKAAKTITAAPMPEVVASASPADDVEANEPQAEAPKLAVQQTEFGVDVGGANSVGGLRALWRGLLKSRSNEPLTALRPIIVVREGRTGLGMQLRLVAGPLSDAAAAAKVCALLIENARPCETTVFDGQRLAMKADEPAATAKPVTAKPVARTQSVPKRGANDEPPKKPDSPSNLSSLLSRR